MKAVQFSQYGGPDVLEVVDMDPPVPGPGEVLIEVAAAGVNPFDWQVRQGYMAEQMPLTFPAGLGSDAAGTVVAVGPDVHNAAVGDVVFGSGRSTYAAQAILTAWAPIPNGVDVQEAAGWGGPVETAVRVLDQLGVTAGQTLLINGASGGVGTALVQIAHARGLTVIGVAGPSNQDYVRSLGATPVEYGDGLTGRVTHVAPDGVDVAVDAAGSGIIPELIAITGTPDRVLSIADFTAPEHGAQISVGGPTSNPAKAFAEVTDIPGFHLPVQDSFSLSEAGKAHQLSAEGHTTGKITLTP